MQTNDGRPPQAVSEVADSINRFVSEAIQHAGLAAGRAGAAADGRSGTDRFATTYVTAVACVSAIHILASLLGHHGDADRLNVGPDDVPKLINPTSTLLAALLVQSMCPQASAEGTSDKGTMIGQAIEFGNSVIFDAIQQVERITGRPVDGWVMPDMLASVRRTAEGTDEPMNRFLAQRRITPGNIH